MNDLGTLLQEKSGQLERWCLQQSNKANDVYALGLLQPLLANRPMLAFTDSALRPYCMVHILNNIAVNARRSIVELGAGISTILMARLLDQNGLDAKIVSVEHDAGWLAAVRRMLEAEGLAARVELAHAPLAPCDLARGDNLWYDLAALDAALPASGIDLMLVDGPPAFQAGKGDARYPALPYMYPRLAKNAAIYLDDLDRVGEKRIVESWEMDYPVKFGGGGPSLAFASIGESFNTRPFPYG